MKKSILVLAAFTFSICTLLTNCNSPAQKLDTAKDNVASANKDLDKANQEYLADVENYRKAIDAQIAVNNQSIEKFKAQAKLVKKDAKDEYNKKIDELQQRNSDLKKKLDEYKPDGKEKWENFKAEFSHDMDNLGKSFQDFTVNNVK